MTDVVKITCSNVLHDTPAFINNWQLFSKTRQFFQQFLQTEGATQKWRAHDLHVYSYMTSGLPKNYPRKRNAFAIFRGCRDHGRTFSEGTPRPLVGHMGLSTEREYSVKISEMKQILGSTGPCCYPKAHGPRGMAQGSLSEWKQWHKGYQV